MVGGSVAEESNQPVTVGVIGLGVMGRAMARRLRLAGYEVAVHTRSADVLNAFASDGFATCTSPRAVAERALVIITSLPDDDAVRSVVIDGIAAYPAMAAGRTIVETSTTSPQTAREVARAMAAAGGALIDSPVSGGETGAIEGTLSVMVGGPAEVLAKVAPVLNVLASRIVHAGPVGAGQVVKACNQLVVLATVEALSEALMLGRAAGLDPDLVAAALARGYAGSPLLEVAGRRMVERDFRPGGRARFHTKDIAILRRLALETGVALPGFEAAAHQVERLLAAGGADLDHAALVSVIEADSGVELAPLGAETSPLLADVEPASLPQPAG